MNEVRDNLLILRNATHILMRPKSTTASSPRRARTHVGTLRSYLDGGHRRCSRAISAGAAGPDTIETNSEGINMEVDRIVRLAAFSKPAEERSR
jgi:hypothetical protein